MLLFVWHSTPVYPHYFILLYPWPFVLVGMVLAWLAERKPAWHAMVWGGGLVVSVHSSVVASQGLLGAFLPQIQLPMKLMTKGI